MKAVSPGLASLIYSGNFQSWLIYTITPVNGAPIRLSSADFDIFDGLGNRFSCGGINSGMPKVDGASSRTSASIKAGLDPDAWTLLVLPSTQDPFTGVFTYPDLMGGTPWLQACRSGLFDGAVAIVQRAFFATAPTLPLSRTNCTALGTTIEFTGLVGQVDANTVTTSFNLNGYNALLSTMMPRNIYQAECRHQLFDSGCTLAALSFANLASALTGSTSSLVLASPAAPGGSGTYQLGRMRFVNGLNAGLQRLISGWDGISAFRLLYPFPFAVSAGDVLNVYPGCDKSLGVQGCGGFANKVNFGGEPNVPLPEIQMG